MIKKSLIALALGTAAFAATPASATFSWWGGSSGGHSHYPGCGHYTGSSSTGSSTSTTSSTSSTSTTSSTGGTTGSTSGTPVPEPGMLGMFGLGLAGIALGRRRRRMAR